MVASAIAALLVVFVAGAHVGRWMVKNQISARWRSALSAPFSRAANAEGADAHEPVDAHDGWVPRNTQLVRIETTTIHLPNSDGWGGGIQPLSGGRIFYATRAGEFGLVDAQGLTKVLPFRVDMNLDALQRHPVFKASNFKINWVRVTDINLKVVQGNRLELLVGHHHFDADGQCMRMRLSRAVLRDDAGEVSLIEPFQTILTTNPCITFSDSSSEFAFDGHFSGGRILRIAGSEDEVLFSTGDHGWRGLRGYPSLSQDDSSTLGKVLRVNLRTGSVGIYAKGLRNPQGLTRDSHGRLWETEHGPRGGDELNLIVEGGNYGWPMATYGTDYGPLPWPLNQRQGAHESGIAPQFAWSPSIGVSNLIELKGDTFPLWKGDLLVASLIGQAIHRLRLEGDRIVYDEPIPFEGRLRDIVELSNGQIALLTDYGKIVLVRNADGHSARPFLDASRQQRRTQDMSDSEKAEAVRGRDFGTSQSTMLAETRPETVDLPGRQVFQANCSSCHSLDSSVPMVGPSLRGVVGRRVGATEFAYSSALSGQRDVWTARRIVEFANDPQKMYAGTAMSGIALSSSERDELEQHLQRAGWPATTRAGTNSKVLPEPRS